MACITVFPASISINMQLEAGYKYKEPIQNSIDGSGSLEFQGSLGCNLGFQGCCLCYIELAYPGSLFRQSVQGEALWPTDSCGTISRLFKTSNLGNDRHISECQQLHHVHTNNSNQHLIVEFCHTLRRIGVSNLFSI